MYYYISRQQRLNFLISYLISFPEWHLPNTTIMTSLQVSVPSSKSFVKLLKQKQFRYTKQRWALLRKETQKQSIVAITVRCELTAMWKTNLFEFLHRFKKNWPLVIQNCRMNGIKMGLSGTQTKPQLAAAVGHCAANTSCLVLCH